MTALELTAPAAQPSLSSPARRAKLAVCGWLAEHNIPFEVGGRRLVRLLDFEATSAKLAPFVLGTPLLSRTNLEALATHLALRSAEASSMA